MSKGGKNKKSQGSKRVLATKKAASSAKKTKPLQFREISEGELKNSRNAAYTYLVK